MDKSVNRLLLIGISCVIVGISLFIYFVLGYAEINNLYNKINFDDLENNKQVSSSDKYYQHLSISEYLSEKLNKNKNLPIKNYSCYYLDYAYHNSVLLHKLIFNGDRTDSSRRGVVEGNIKSLNEMLGPYASCKNSALYKQNLSEILSDIEKSNTIYEGSKNTFLLNEDNNIQDEYDENNVIIEDDIYNSDENKIIN